MPITCDECGHEPHTKGKPDSVHWLTWLGDLSTNVDAFMIIERDERLMCICRDCFSVIFDDTMQKLT